MSAGQACFVVSIHREHCCHLGWHGAHKVNLLSFCEMMTLSYLCPWIENGPFLRGCQLQCIAVITLAPLGRRTAPRLMVTPLSLSCNCTERCFGLRLVSQFLMAWDFFFVIWKITFSCEISRCDRIIDCVL